MTTQSRPTQQNREALDKAAKQAFEAVAAIQRAQNSIRMLDHRIYNDIYLGKLNAKAECAAWDLLSALNAEQLRTE